MEALYNRMFKKYYSGEELTNWRQIDFFGGGNANKYKSEIKRLKNILYILQMKRRIFHLHIKPDKNKYYGSLQALFLDNKDLKVSKFTLDRYDFVKPFENEVCVINKGFVLSAGDIRGLAPK